MNIYFQFKLLCRVQINCGPVSFFSMKFDISLKIFSFFSVIGKIPFPINTFSTFTFFKTLSMITSKKCDWHWEKGEGEGRYPKKIANKKQYARCSFKKTYHVLLYDALYMGMNSRFKVSISNFLNARRPFMFSFDIWCLSQFQQHELTRSIYLMGC